MDEKMVVERVLRVFESFGVHSEVLSRYALILSHYTSEEILRNPDEVALVAGLSHACIARLIAAIRIHIKRKFTDVLRLIEADLPDLCLAKLDRIGDVNIGSMSENELNRAAGLNACQTKRVKEVYKMWKRGELI